MHSLLKRIGRRAAAALAVLGASAALADPAGEYKSLANGIYMTAPFSAEVGATAAKIAVDRIDNSSTRSTATLRLELWVSETKPDRGSGYNGWRLATATLDPLPNGRNYTGIVRDVPLDALPPPGTYWMILALDQADAASQCAGNGGYCIQDSLVFDAQVTFGAERLEKAVPIVEYYNADLDHYFITAEGAEAVIVDSGAAGRWERTGESFWGWADRASAPAEASPVYRFYAGGTTNSHFYTALESEKSSLIALNPSNQADKGWAYEGIAFYALASDAKATTFCKPGWRVTQRAYNDGFRRGTGSNHRYIMNPGVLDAMRNRGWQPEGTQVCFKDSGQLRLVPQPLTCAVGVRCQGVIAKATGGGDGVYRVGLPQPYRFSAQGATIPGLTINDGASTGISVDGIPTSAGTFTLQGVVRDAGGGLARGTLTVRVESATPVWLRTAGTVTC